MVLKIKRMQGGGHGLAPPLVISIKPSNESPIRAGDWSAVRENLQLVLNGNAALHELTHTLAALGFRSAHVGSVPKCAKICD